MSAISRPSSTWILGIGWTIIARAISAMASGE
jgi:hypothetical protein